MNSDDLIKYLNFEDSLYKNPNSEPYVILSGYETWTPPEHKRLGLYSQFIGYHSYMINVEAKGIAFDELDFSLMTAEISGFFEEDASGEKKYVTGEAWERREGLIVEPLHVERNWPGLGITLYEPSQRLILYLNLLNERDEWINPYKSETVIRRIKKEDLLRKLSMKIEG